VPGVSKRLRTHRQRTNDSHVPNTQYVIYVRFGESTFTTLSVNSRMLRMLILLCSRDSRAIFPVLRQDAFAQDKVTGCRICGPEGHYVAQLEIKRPLPPEKFISSCRHSARVSRIRVECEQYPFAFRIGYSSYALLETSSCRICHHLRFAKEQLILSSGSRRWTQNGWISDEPWSTCSSRAQIILEGLVRRDEIFRKRRESEHPQCVSLMT
jgi:hypothetical protein